MTDPCYEVHDGFILPNGRREDFVLTIDESTMLAETLVEEALPPLFQDFPQA